MLRTCRDTPGISPCDFFLGGRLAWLEGASSSAALREAVEGRLQNGKGEGTHTAEGLWRCRVGVEDLRELERLAPDFVEFALPTSARGTPGDGCRLLHETRSASSSPYRETRREEEGETETGSVCPRPEREVRAWEPGEGTSLTRLLSSDDRQESTVPQRRVESRSVGSAGGEERESARGVSPPP